MAEITLKTTPVEDLGLTKYDARALPYTGPEQSGSLGKSFIGELPGIHYAGGLIYQSWAATHDDTPKIDPFKKWKESGLSDDEFHNAMNIETEMEWDNYMFNLNEQQERDRVFAAHGLTGTAAKIASNIVGDPVTYATFGAGAMLKAKQTAAVTFGATGASAGVAYTGEQALARPYSTDEEDLIINTLSGAILGATLGKGVDTFSKLKSKGIVNKDFNEFARDAITKNVPSESQNLSAAAVKLTSADNVDYRIGGNIVARSLNKLISIASPRARGQGAISKTTAELYAKFMGSSARTKSNLEDQVASGISFGEETEKLRQLSVAKMRTLSDELKVLEKSGVKVSDQDYEDAARIAWGGGSAENASPTVKAILKHDEAYGEYRALMETEGVSNFKAKESYGRPFMFNQHKLMAKMDETVEKLVKVYKAERAIASEKMAKILDEIADLKARYSPENIQDAIKYYDDELDRLRQLRDSADEELIDDAYTHIRNSAMGSMLDYSTSVDVNAQVLKSKFFNRRSIDPIDFIDVAETNPIVLHKAYIDSVAPHIALNRVFPQKNIKGIMTDYSEKIKKEMDAALKSGDQKLFKKLEKEASTTDKDINNAYNTETGMYSAAAVAQVGHFAPFLNATSNITNIAMLGGQVMGSVSEVAAVTLHHGLGDTGLQVTKLLKSFVSDISVANASKKEMGYYAIGLEVANNKILNDRLGHEVLAREIGGTSGEYLQKSNTLFQRLNGAVYYDSMVRIAGGMIQAGVIKERLLRFGKLTKDELSDLAYLGIDKANYKAISEQLKKHGTEKNGIFFANPNNWDDVTARETWINAIRRDNRRTFVQADLGDTPFFARTPIGKNLLKFKSWSIAATQKYLIQSAQRPVQALPAIGFMVGVSGVIDYLYNKSIGRDISTDPDELLWAGINRSGIVGVLPEIGGSALLNRLANIESGGARVYDYKSVPEIMAGPVGSLIESGFNMLPLPRYDDGKWTLPYHNKDGTLSDSSVNSFFNVLPIPVVKPFLKENLTPIITGNEK